MKCDCGSEKKASRHVSLPGGWMSLAFPLCEVCRLKRYPEFVEAFETFKIKSREEKKRMPGVVVDE